MNDKQASRLWFWQRATAVIIFLVLAAHVWNVHYADLGGPILFAGVALRLKNLLILLTDGALLFFGLFHGLNGVRMILLDFDLFQKHEKPISWLLILTGLFFFFWGLRGLWAFIITRS